MLTAPCAYAGCLVFDALSDENEKNDAVKITVRVNDDCCAAQKKKRAYCKLLHFIIIGPLIIT